MQKGFGGATLLLCVWLWGCGLGEEKALFLEPIERQSGPALEPTEPLSLGPLQRDEPLALLAKEPGEIALMQVATGEIKWRVATRFSPTDIVWDRGHRQWAVLEYEDESQSQLSFWQLQKEPLGGFSLNAKGTIAMEGYGRMVPTPQGLVVIEQEGLQTRWKWIDWELSKEPQARPGPALGGIWTQNGGQESQLWGFGRLSTGPGWQGLWAHAKVGQAGFLTMESRPGVSWMTLRGALRACSYKSGQALLVYRAEQDIFLARVSLDGTLLQGPLPLQAPMGAQPDSVVYEPRSNTAFILLGPEGQLLSVPLDPVQSIFRLEVEPWTPASQEVFSRRLALEPKTQHVWVGTGWELRRYSWSFSADKVLFEQDGYFPGLHWPIALSEDY